jgi:hypothetical protein
MQATSTVCCSLKLGDRLCTQISRHVDDYDPTISYHHMVLRCVQFDEDAATWNVAPMVYAEDTSVNGTVLTREYPTDDGSTNHLDHKLTKSMGPVLLQDGDCLYFSKSTFVQYSEISPGNDFNMSFIMDCELKVGFGICVYDPLRGTHLTNSVSKQNSLSTLVSLALVAKVKSILLGIITLLSKWHAKLSLWLVWIWAVIKVYPRKRPRRSHPAALLESSRSNCCARYTASRSSTRSSRT